MFGFLGPNGSGKTTTVRMLTTILKPTAGSAKVAGFDVSKEQGEVRERVGVALQEVGLDGLMTAREMLVLQARRSEPTRSRRTPPRSGFLPPWACWTSTPRSAWASTREA